MMPKNHNSPHDKIIYIGAIKEKVPEEPGVYIGYNGKTNGNLRVTYVGRTKNLRRRLHRHEKGCTHFSYEVIKDSKKLRIKREKYLIEKFKPAWNMRR